MILISTILKRRSIKIIMRNVNFERIFYRGWFSCTVGSKLVAAATLSDAREGSYGTWDRRAAWQRYTGIWRHGRRLEWRPLTSNVYYSSHSETRKSSLLCIRTSVENGGPWHAGAHGLPPPRLWIPSASHTYVSSIIVMLVELPSATRHSIAPPSLLPNSDRVFRFLFSSFTR